MVDLVALFEPPQDGHGVLDRRLTHEDLLEAPLKGGILLDVLAVFIKRGRPDETQLAAGQQWLDHVASVHGALGRSCADDGVDLVDEGDDLALGILNLLEDGLESLLELAAVLRTRHHRSQIEGHDPLVAEALGDIALDDAQGEALDDGGLAHPRLADQDRVVLGPS